MTLYVQTYNMCLSKDGQWLHTNSTYPPTMWWLGLELMPNRIVPALPSLDPIIFKLL